MTRGTIKYDYLVAELHCVNSEKNEAVKECRVLERWALAATGAIWTWLATHPDRSYDLLWWGPALIVAFFYSRTRALMDHIDGLSDYIIRVERSFPLPIGLGFEGDFAKSPRRKTKRRTGHLFWWLLLLVTIGVPIVVWGSVMSLVLSLWITWVLIMS